MRGGALSGKGLIIIGYQGVGKSSAAGADGIECVDLESGNFFVDGERDDNWYVVYCRIAMSLARQGYTVFVSSHDVVRDELAKYEDKRVRKCIFCPPLEFKDFWITRLKERYLRTGLEKDYKALVNAQEKYEESITSLINDERFTTFSPRVRYYRLQDYVEKIRKHYGSYSMLGKTGAFMVLDEFRCD